jgi:uncharacterized protein
VITTEERLCTQCGLCCDGSLFADVELANDREALKLEILGLEIDDTDRPVLVQPCAALKNKRCSLYQFRPKCCRTFECRLLKKVKAGELSIETALHQIKTLKRHDSLEKTFLR